MIEFMAAKMTGFIKKHTKIDSKLEDVYRYGIEITVSSIINILLIIICSILLKNVISGFLFLLFFIPLRQYTGGYHANTYLKCNLLFTFSFLAVLFLAHFVNAFLMPESLAAILILAAVPVCVFSPIENPNKRLSASKTEKCRKISIITYVALSCLSVVTATINIFYGALMAFTIILTSVLVIAAILSKRRGGVA
jgi:accessory gene regulator B